jgi:hypothetical protein
VRADAISNAGKAPPVLFCASFLALGTLEWTDEHEKWCADWVKKFLGQCRGPLRYPSGTGYALYAAMHAPHNLVFVAAVPAELSEAVERTLIGQFRTRLAYNYLGVTPAPETGVPLRHSASPPRFCAAFIEGIVDC